jgi:GNAT superfamily N-acetyltransferase
MITLRGLEAADRPQWDGLWAQYQAFYKASIAAETSDVTFARLLDASVPMHGLIAQIDSEVVGMVHYIYHYSAWTIGPYCYLQDLITRAEFRGKGVATALIKAVYEKAAAHGASRVYWLTQETNETAIRLYESLADRPGFIQFRKLM